MSYSSIVISSGHGLHVRGASSDMLDEVDAARLVVEDLASALRTRFFEVITFHDDISVNQNKNLNRITDFHNKQDHAQRHQHTFQCVRTMRQAYGHRVLYVTQADLADKMSEAIAKAGGFIDRGPKKNTGLHFLNQTDMPSILIEVCFVDSVADVGLFDSHYEKIIDAMVDALSSEQDEEKPTAPSVSGKKVIGKCSWFGGPNDTGVSASRLAFIYEIEDAPQLLLPEQPKNTTGLARRLNPFVHYIAMRWDYDVTSKQPC
jgi:N-acetylmuramoyl-L-alanine amidase